MQTRTVWQGKIQRSRCRICPNRTNKLLFSSLVSRSINRPNIIWECMLNMEMCLKDNNGGGASLVPFTAAGNKWCGMARLNPHHYNNWECCKGEGNCPCRQTSQHSCSSSISQCQQWYSAHNHIRHISRCVLQHMGKCNRNSCLLSTLRNSNPDSNHLWGWLFFNMSGTLMLVFKGPDITINERCYCSTLRDLCNTIKTKHPGILTRDVFMLNDNVPIRITLFSRHYVPYTGWCWIMPQTAQTCHCIDFQASGPLKEGP
jgi:hypothetical protein